MGYLLHELVIPPGKTVSPSPTKFQDANEAPRQSWYYVDQSLEDCKVTRVSDGYLGVGGFQQRFFGVVTFLGAKTLPSTKLTYLESQIIDSKVPN